ncbi:MAG TPA: SRPBCC domain-containing protein [Caulobacteraceae bacterium]|jgi:uncharacterized protein YndB with AHSA1/START domain|nr:SRPBCC domain-containing protein [Caulobacteraceae bacterium]
MPQTDTPAATVLDLDGDLTATADGGWVIAFDRRIARPLQKVWAALTVPERIADWLGVATVDLRIGGVYHVAFHPTEDDPDSQIDGVITALAPPRVLEYRWRLPEGWDSSVRWELEPDGPATRLRFTHLFPPEETRDLIGTVAGWHDFLNMIPSAADGVRAEWGVGWSEIDAGYHAKLAGKGPRK